MNTNVLQTLRYKLQKRLKRINTADFQIYHSIVVQTFKFLRENPVVRGILDDLERRVPTAGPDSERLFNGELITGENETEHIALAYALIKRTVADAGDREVHLGCQFSSNSKYKEGADAFTEMFIEPLFEYIDEQIDDRRTLLGVLLKLPSTVSSGSAATPCARRSRPTPNEAKRTWRAISTPTCTTKGLTSRSSPHRFQAKLTSYLHRPARIDSSQT